MNREILFRGFHKAENGKESIYIDGQPIKGKWMYGDLQRNLRSGERIVIEYENLDDSLWIETPYIVIPETVGQYSGLEDKNNKKMFDNDVVYATEHLTNGYIGIGEVDLHYKVEYVDRLAKYVFNPLLENGKYNNNNFELDMLHYKKEELEVIGTIFDKEVNDNGSIFNK